MADNKSLAEDNEPFGFFVNASLETVQRNMAETSGEKLEQGRITPIMLYYNNFVSTLMPPAKPISNQLFNFYKTNKKYLWNLCKRSLTDSICARIG